MNTRLARPWLPVGMLLLAAAVFALTGCEKEGMPADTDPPTGSQITNPEDGSALNSPVINVRGQAEVGATIDVYINDVYQASGVASPAVPSGPLGRFLVEDVDLGVEGEKTLRAVITDLYGNVSDDPIEIHLTLDQTAPPIAFERVDGTQWSDTLGGVWQTSLPQTRFVGRTNVSSSGQRVRYGINEFLPDSTYTFPGAPGEPDSIRFYVPITVPPLVAAHPESLVTYYAEAYDVAGNVASTPFSIYWVAAGKETAIAYDDGDYGSYDNQITGQSGMMLAVKFQAPVWANYITGIQFHTMNDQQTNPQDPQAPTTMPFLIWIWRFNQDELPGIAANDGMSSGDPYSYPEDTWVEWSLPNPINITNNSYFPDKQFFAGMEWQYRSNPIFGLDTDLPIDYRSYRWNWSSWELQTLADAMVRVIVSDLPNISGKARTATLTPVVESAPRSR